MRGSCCHATKGGFTILGGGRGGGLIQWGEGGLEGLLGLLLVASSRAEGVGGRVAGPPDPAFSPPPLKDCGAGEVLHWGTQHRACSRSLHCTNEVRSVLSDLT